MALEPFAEWRRQRWRRSAHEAERTQTGACTSPSKSATIRLITRRISQPPELPTRSSQRSTRRSLRPPARAGGHAARRCAAQPSLSSGASGRRQPGSTWPAAQRPISTKTWPQSSWASHCTWCCTASSSPTPFSTMTAPPAVASESRWPFERHGHVFDVELTATAATASCDARVIVRTTSAHSAKGTSRSVGHRPATSGVASCTRRRKQRPYSTASPSTRSRPAKDATKLFASRVSNSQVLTAFALPTWIHSTQRAHSESQLPRPTPTEHGSSTGANPGICEYNTSPCEMYDAATAGRPGKKMSSSPRTTTVSTTANMSSSQAASTFRNTKRKGCNTIAGSHTSACNLRCNDWLRSCSAATSLFATRPWSPKRRLTCRCTWIDKPPPMSCSRKKRRNKRS
mmetsp:Transcript_29751/g.85599  ORF Transcript_29751/g.85599 Transcript_29751/m.85599 type:complete len:400 (-) Transcript_29751:1297-2496(-)